MKLWLLRPVKDWKPWYDKAFGFVIRAETEEEARKLAETQSGDESRDARYGDPARHVWLDPTRTTCQELTTDGNSEIILRDFAAA